MDASAPLRVPRHVAVIMDGNGRWAESRGLPRERGHEEGAESVREIVRECRRAGVEALTLYSFSTENWSRPATEVGALMSLLHRYVLHERAEIMEQGIRLRAIGQIDRLPFFVRQPLRALVSESSANRGMTLNLALSYGARAELVDAAKALAAKVAAGRLKVEDIDEQSFAAELSTAGQPDPDLLIRTSGELRVSNFLLWQIAYAEIYVTELPWPEFRKAQLEDAFRVFSQRQRRFGKTGAQLRAESRRA
ncbi:MAG: di-trans,poly-cis-decaprenylcistransferase [Deltaproteobacteria bacterium]|jgi:undecaprenyl diphosphate synthase|nr:di-trans,poly-cis-decaprenylcistransferase [Deltaproteobacteria bacterium]